MPDLAKHLVSHSDTPPEHRTGRFSVVICQRPSDGHFLLVKERACRGWWVPAGGVDSHETFLEGAVRECKEEAGVDIRLLSVIDVHKSSKWGISHMIFLAEPVDEKAPPKSVPDFESQCAKWMSLDDIIKLGDENQMRGPDEIEFMKRVAQGIKGTPISFFGLQHTG